MAGEIVQVRRQWDDYRIAKYRIDDISGLHWSDESGGVRASAPRAFIHGYVLCNGMIEGELAHSCSHGPPPHQVKVCITKKKGVKLSGTRFLASWRRGRSNQPPPLGLAWKHWLGACGA